MYDSLGQLIDDSRLAHCVIHFLDFTVAYVRNFRRFPRVPPNPFHFLVWILHAGMIHVLLVLVLVVVVVFIHEFLVDIVDIGRRFTVGGVVRHVFAFHIFKFQMIARTH